MQQDQPHPTHVTRFFIVHCRTIISPLFLHSHSTTELLLIMRSLTSYSINSINAFSFVTQVLIKKTKHNSPVQLFHTFATEKIPDSNYRVASFLLLVQVHVPSPQEFNCGFGLGKSSGCLIILKFPTNQHLYL